MLVWRLSGTGVSFLKCMATACLSASTVICCSSPREYASHTWVWCGLTYQRLVVKRPSACTWICYISLSCSSVPFRRDLRPLALPDLPSSMRRADTVGSGVARLVCKPSHTLCMCCLHPLLYPSQSFALPNARLCILTICHALEPLTLRT
jgi:hypothetical protein